MHSGKCIASCVFGVLIQEHLSVTISERLFWKLWILNHWNSPSHPQHVVFQRPRHRAVSVSWESFDLEYVVSCFPLISPSFIRGPLPPPPPLPQPPPGPLLCPPHHLPGDRWGALTTWRDTWRRTAAAIAAAASIYTGSVCVHARSVCVHARSVCVHARSVCVHALHGGLLQSPSTPETTNKQLRPVKTPHTHTHTHNHNQACYCFCCLRSTTTHTHTHTHTNKQMVMQVF